MKHIRRIATLYFNHPSVGKVINLTINKVNLIESLITKNDFKKNKNDNIHKGKNQEMVK